MIRIGTLRLEYEGDDLLVTAEIDGEAHSVGLSARRFSYRMRLGEDLGTPEGADTISAAAHHVLTNLITSLHVQWRVPEEPLF